MALMAVIILLVKRVISLCFAIYGIKKPAVLEPSNIIICPSQMRDSAFFAIFLFQPTLPVSEKLLLTGHVHKIPAAGWKKNSYLLSPRHSVTGIKAPIPPL
mgnify:CR=1 FL=1